MCPKEKMGVMINHICFIFQLHFILKNLIKFHLCFNKTALYFAVEKENAELIRILLTNENTDVNCLCISYKFFLNKILQSHINFFLNSFFNCEIETNSFLLSTNNLYNSTFHKYLNNAVNNQ